MRTKSAVSLLALAGLLLAVSIGLAAYLVSRDSVGLPVTKLEPVPRELAPTLARKRATTLHVTKGATTTVDDRHGGTTVTTDDRSGRGGGGSGSGTSGHGGGGGDD